VHICNVDYFWRSEGSKNGGETVLCEKGMFQKPSHKIFPVFNLLTDAPCCGIILASQFGAFCTFCYANGANGSEAVRNRALPGAGVTPVIHNNADFRVGDRWRSHA